MTYIRPIRILAAITLVILVTTQSPVQFESNEHQLTLRADWLQDTQALEAYVDRYNQFISRKTIKKITLSFAYCPDPQYLISSFFSKSISVESLSVNLDTCKIGDQGLKTILNNINKDSIRQLHLILSSTGITTKAGGILGTKITNFKLRVLKLGLMMAKIGRQGLSDMFMNPVSQHLQDLSLDLTTNKLTMESFSNFTYFLSRVPTNRLFRVELFVHGNRIESNGTWDIARALKRFSNLEVFKFDGYFNHIKTQGVKPITILLQKLIKLRHLSLDFDLNYIEDEGGRLLGSSIHFLNNLQILEIGVSTKNFGYNGYEHIVNGIMNLKKLKHLNFRCGVNRIDARGGKAIKDLLFKLPNLEYLELHLHQNAIYSEGLAYITEAIERLNNLKSLVLNVGFNEIRGKAVAELFKMISQKKIGNVWISLSNNPIEDSDIRSVLEPAKAIIRASNKFQLELLYTKINSPTAQQLRQQLVGQGFILHINSEQEVRYVQEQIEKGDEEQRMKQRQSGQL